MDDLAERSGYSLSGVSTKMKMIESLGFADRVKKPGSKKVYFYINKSLKDLMVSKIRKGIQVEVNPVKETIPAILEKYKKEYVSAKDAKFKAQYENLKKYYDDMLKIEVIMKKLLEDLGRM